MDIDELKEKKLHFCGTQYIYWPVMIDYHHYYITAFNNGSLYIHISDNSNETDAVLFPKLSEVDSSSLSQIINVVLEILIQSAKTYNGNGNVFTAYFLLQTYIELPIEDMLDRTGVSVQHISDTVIGGMRFDKYSIEIKKDKL